MSKVNKPNTNAWTRPLCNCKRHCAICGGHIPDNGVGWAGQYCSSKCQQADDTKQTQRHSLWWDKNKEDSNGK